MRLTTAQGGQHHLTIPDRKNLRIGTLAAILAKVAEHHKTDRDTVAKQIFDS